MQVGDFVEKVGGDYDFGGYIVAAFTKLAGEKRYIVENEDRILHIFSEKNLRVLHSWPEENK